MAPKPCKSCGGTAGAHYAFCFAARLFERVMGKGFPLFPPGAFTRPAVVIDGLATLGEAQRAAREADGRLEIVIEPDGGATAVTDAEREGLAATVQALREDLEREREGMTLQREAFTRMMAERDELRALLDAATAPEDAAQDEDDGSAEQVLAELQEREQAPEPWWWNTPTGREARASVALDGETQSLGEPMPTMEQLAQVPDREPDVTSPASGALDEAEVESLEEAAAELEAAQDPGERVEVDQTVEAAFAEAARRRERIEELREKVRAKMSATTGLTQKALAEGIGLNSGTVSQILNGKAHGPSALTHLERMLIVAGNIAGDPSPVVEPDQVPQQSNGAGPGFQRGESWAAVERFLAEVGEWVKGAWTSAPQLQEAYEAWRGPQQAPAVHPTTLGQAAVARGFERTRRNVEGRQLRGYGHLQLRTLVSAGVPNESRGGGDEAPQDSDGEPNAGAPAHDQGPQLLHPDARKEPRDDTGALLTRLHEQGKSVRGTLASFLAAETTMAAATSTVPAPDPARAIDLTSIPVEHPAGWDDLPGKELHNPELRAMASTLVKEQGWGYKRNHGRNGKPKLRNPKGQVYAMAASTGDYRSVKNVRAGLRRLGAAL